MGDIKNKQLINFLKLLLRKLNSIHFHFSFSLTQGTCILFIKFSYYCILRNQTDYFWVLWSGCENFRTVSHYQRGSNRI
jgi:hypothetical protein